MAQHSESRSAAFIPPCSGLKVERLPHRKLRSAVRSGHLGEQTLAGNLQPVVQSLSPVFITKSAPRHLRWRVPARPARHHPPPPNAARPRPSLHADCGGRNESRSRRRAPGTQPWSAQYLSKHGRARFEFDLAKRFIGGLSHLYPHASAPLLAVVPDLALFALSIAQRLRARYCRPQSISPRAMALYLVGKFELPLTRS